MKNDYAKRQQALMDRAYREGHKHGLSVGLDLCKMAFLVALNEELSVGKDRFERVLQRVNGIFVNDVINDAELTRSRLERECERITGSPAEDFLRNWRI